MKMKKSVFLFAIICILFTIQTALAQNPVATLQHNGTTTVFYGLTCFNDALTASVNGDTLNLSAGIITAPSPITKKITIIGAGHFPDSANVVKRTYINGSITINKGADSLQLEGLYLSGNIYYQADASINYVKVRRCNFGGAIFNSTSSSFAKNFCSFEECYINAGIDFFYYGDNLLIKHCIITGTIGISNGYTYVACGSIIHILKSAIIDGNIILNSPCNFASYSLGLVSSSLIQNNITFASFYGASPNNYLNNLFTFNPNYGTNSSSNNNYINILQSDIFVNQTGSTINYAHDYHLKNPSTYLGTDGTQVGIYGSATPFKDNGYPSNPQVVSKNIGKQTDGSGNLPINITVKAQVK